MDEDQQLKLANRISGGLPEVTRSEWMRWVQVANSYGVERAIEVAGKLGNDETLRPAIKRSNQLIAKTMGRFTKDLSLLTPIERDSVIGYVSRILMVKAAASIEQKRKGKSIY